MGQNFPTKNVNAQTPDFVQEKTGQNIIGQGFSARSDLLGRICNPTAISMSICNAENGKRKRIINPYTKCCRITNTAERVLLIAYIFV